MTATPLALLLYQIRVSPATLVALGPAHLLSEVLLERVIVRLCVRKAAYNALFSDSLRSPVSLPFAVHTFLAKYSKHATLQSDSL